MNEIVQREITIDAPISIVWDVITQPEHISKWYCNSAEFELKPGGKGHVSWDKFGNAPLEIVTVDKPYFFSFQWVAPDEESRRIGGRTLIEFQLFEEGESTKLQVRESGFDQLELTKEEKTSLYERHNNGWVDILTNLQKYLSTIK